MTGRATPPVVAGWTILAHPLFLDQVEALIADVERARARDAAAWRRSNAAKRLAAIDRLAFETIPADPARPDWRLGDALGDDRRHWFRAKFFQQYRLFFRWSGAERLIIHGWVNDDRTLRAYESGDDAYRVFARMLARGRPPDDWVTLRAEAGDAAGRLAAVFTQRAADE